MLNSFLFHDERNDKLNCLLFAVSRNLPYISREIHGLFYKMGYN